MKPAAKHAGKHNEMEGEIVRVDKMTLTERRMTKLSTRGAFLSFLMWAFVFIAATIGKRASWQKENNWWIRCTLKKSIFMLWIASCLGVWNLVIKHKLGKEMHKIKDGLENEVYYQKSFDLKQFEKDTMQMTLDQ